MTNITAYAVAVQTSPSHAVSSRDAPVSGIKIHLKSHPWFQTCQTHRKELLFSSLQVWKGRCFQIKRSFPPQEVSLTNRNTLQVYCRKAQNFNVCCEKATATEQYVRVNKEEHVCLWTFDLCIILSLEHKFEDYKQVVFWGLVMWCQVTVSQENLSLEACSGSGEFMYPCFCSTYFILFRQIKARDGKRNVCTSALFNVSYTLLTIRCVDG